MKKGMPLTKRIDAIEARMQKAEIAAVMLKTDDICADIRDAKTVVAVANEAWGGQHDSFVGVLDLVDYKLNQIERAAQSIMVFAKAQKASA